MERLNIYSKQCEIITDKFSQGKYLTTTTEKMCDKNAVPKHLLATTLVIPLVPIQQTTSN